MNKKRKAKSLEFINKWKVACLLGLLLTCWIQEVKGEPLPLYTQTKKLKLGEISVEPWGDNTSIRLTPIIPEGFKITNLYLGEERMGEVVGTDAYGTYTIDYNRLINAGAVFTADYTLTDINDPKLLFNIFKVYAPDAVVLENGIIKINGDIEGESKTLNFVAGGPPISIYISGNFRFSKFYYWTLNGGDLTLKGEEGSNSYMAGELTMNAGSLTIEGKKAGIQTLNLNGGDFLNNGSPIWKLTMTNGSAELNNSSTQDIIMEDGFLKTDSCRILTFTVRNGTVNTGDGSSESGVLFNELTIDGDVTITGNYTLENASLYRNNHLTKKGLIKQGTVTLKQLRINPGHTLVVEDGTVTFENIGSANNWGNLPEKSSAAIQQDGGNILFKNCYLKSNYQDDGHADYYIVQNDGKLSIEGGSFLRSGEVGLLRVAGENARTEVKGVNFLGGKSHDNYCAIYQEKGSVKVLSGVFRDPICVEGGELSISDAKMIGDPQWNDIPSKIHILGSEAKVTLSGGFYKSPSVYIDPSLSIQPESLLAEGHGFYTWDQRYQPDLRLTDVKRSYSSNGVSYECLVFGQVKQINAGSGTNDLLEAAKEANVGLSGTDVKVTPLKDGNYELDINTDTGLAWFASMFTSRSDKITDNGEEFLRKASVVKLTADLDMSAYNWIPFDFIGRKFDGQGHCISGLKVKQSDAAFMLSGPDTLANLIVKGSFESLQTLYTIEEQNAAALITKSHSVIINCGVQQSTVSCTTTDVTDATIGGLVAINWKVSKSTPQNPTPQRFLGSIQNSYMTGSVLCRVPDFGGTFKSGRHYSHTVGGIAGENRGNISNCYHADGIVEHPLVDMTITNLSVKKEDIGVNNEYFSTNPTITNCTTDPDLETLNGHVTDNNTALETGKIAWSKWITTSENNGYPIHDKGKDPSVIDMPFTLKVEGNGVLDGYYIIGRGEEPDIKLDSIRFSANAEADTTVRFTNGRTFHVIARPNKGASLDSLVRVVNEVDSVVMEDYKANLDTSFVINQPTQCIAYFHTDTLYVEKDTTVIGGVGEITKVDHVSISEAGTDEKAAVIKLGNVTVEAKPGAGGGQSEATTQIESTAYVVLQISGKNNLGKLVNEGTTLIQTAPDASEDTKLETTAVINKGTLRDETGSITEVKDDTGKTLLALNDSQGDQVEEGQIAIVRAKATVPAGATVTFQWQLWDGREWKDVEGGSATYPKIQTRSVRLRASATDTDTHEDRYETGELTEDGTLQYRCLIITSVNQGPGDPAISTTLTTYTEVKVIPKSDPGTDSDPDPTPTPTPDYTWYEVALPELTGATTNPAAGKYTVKEDGTFSFTLTLDADYSQSHPEVKAGDQVLVADANGKYTIPNVRGDLTITITGITLNTPTANAEVEQPVKVWAEGHTLYVYTAARETIRLYTFSGQLLKQMDNAGRIAITGLPEGNYLIRIGNRSWKIAL